MQRYIVQWVTKFDSKNPIIAVLGYCVMDMKSFGMKTLFYHESDTVCQ